HHFRVLGDPFLAMNEINYAITRLEDTEDYVVSNYLSYYVHQKVDHPRYLCNQCHLDSDVTVHPYRDQCTINISFDYGWSNHWYRDYGYFPVYYNPVYVYYDPWTWRPWVNFWYDPWYRCVSYPGWRWQDPVYVWCDSPYYRDYADYRFDGVRRKEGRGLFRPETDRRRRTKTAEYRDVSRIVAERGPSESQRNVMINKERTRRVDRPGGAGAAVVGRGGVAPSVGGGRSSTVVGRGEAPATRARPEIQKRKASDARNGGGLRIRRPTVRGEGSDRTTRVGTTPVNRSRGGAVDRTGRQRDDRRIQPVEPRRQSTRIWNSNRGSRTEERGNVSGRGGAVRQGKKRSRSDSDVRRGGGSRSGGDRRVAPARKNEGTRKKGGSAVKTQRGGSSGSRATTRSGSGSSVKSRSSGGSGSGSKSKSRTSGGRGGGSRSKTRGGR
ncbi:hypothetical protein CSB20_01875, partial [bacterium DOLZORAL124_64_63]